MSTLAVVATTHDDVIPPTEVQLSTLCWVGAVAAGGVETVLAVADRLTTGTGSLTAIGAQVLVRLAVFIMALALASRLWNGRNWARWTLAGLLGVVGTLSLVAGPVSWLTEHQLTDLDPDGRFAAFAIIRTIHLAALVAAVVLMFLPAANRYFRSAGPRPWGQGRR
jgi:hypothetical protein